MDDAPAKEAGEVALTRFSTGADFQLGRPRHAGQDRNRLMCSLGPGGPGR